MCNREVLLIFDLDDFLPFRLHLAAESTSQRFYPQYRDVFKINRTEWRVFFHIGQHGPITANRISRMSRLEKSKISRAITKLEERGWVERSYSQGHRRSHDLLLTHNGTETFQALAEMAAQFNDMLEEHLGKGEMKKILEQLRSLEDRINQLPEAD
ncbi:MarR family winged helix-turn-helix transcriptional regulator [Sphingorhabdus sp. SMR4y]|uniref:MarR family winged helix-turn-helix transcriptional regulator n=1 Tax=Sphingorhabdus sp. SMR4y TaxID=2584094 RepID=UPI000B5FFE2E|nr:MarR family winged helix-turn-helix transcriptional regulator [Sphingorhabdus sp. SMR4y]ASK89709.1 transcriptional regulator SlyA [Sphingorhabdus sp. SMR4y]